MRRSEMAPTQVSKDSVRFSDAQLRRALLRVAESTNRLCDREGAELIAQFTQYLVPGIVRTALRSGRSSATWLQPAEVLHTILVELFAENGRVACAVAVQARDSWGYLAVCASEWVLRICRSSWEEFDERGTLHLIAASQHRLTNINEMVRIATQLLLPFAPQISSEEMHSVLLWLAHNPPQRISHEAEDRAAILAHFPTFTATQVAAIANIAWGGRPRRKETSLFAALLLQPDFRPESSPTHIRALLHFRQVMRREERSSPGLLAA